MGLEYIFRDLIAPAMKYFPKYLCKMRLLVWTLGRRDRTSNPSLYCYNNHMTNLSLLCKTKDNFEMYYDQINSHAATHFNDAPKLKELVIELLRGLKTTVKKLPSTLIWADRSELWT